MIWIGIAFLLPMLFYAAYLVAMGIYFQQLPPEKENSTSTSISVIVPARNEAHQIRDCLHAISRQDHPDFEIIVVNDHSEDETADLVQAFQQDFPNLKLIDLDTQTGVAYKKAAVSAGIQASEKETIVTTDADCSMGPHWLSSIAAHFDASTGLVSGPVALTGQSVFQQFQSLEFMGLIAVGAGAIQAGRPTMCNGANLAYRKRVFEAVDGFKDIDHIASGDDELLMHKIASQTNWKIRFAKDRAAIVSTPALAALKDFRQQRIRWVSKSTQYKNWRITATLVFAYLGVLGIPLLGILSVFFPALWPFFFAQLGLKVLSELSVLLPAARFFGNLHLLKWLLPEQFAHVAYVLWVGLAGNQKSYTWKGRKVQ